MNRPTNKVLQIDLKTGLIIRTWESATEPQHALKYNAGRIMLVCKGKAKKSNGYFWVYENIELQKQYNCYQDDYKNSKSLPRANKKKVVLVDNNTFEIIKTYDSRDEIALALGTYSSNVKHSIRNGMALGDKLIFDEQNFLLNKETLKEIYFNNIGVCQICNLRFKNLNSLSAHIQFAHNMTAVDYTIKHIMKTDNRPTCLEPGCDKHPRYTVYSFKNYCEEHSRIPMSTGGKKGGLAPAWSKGLTKNDHPSLMRYSINMSGANNPFYRKKHSPELIQQIANKRKLSEQEILSRLNKRSKDFTFNFDYSNYDSRTQKIECICNICKIIEMKTLVALERDSLCHTCFPLNTKSIGEKQVEDFIRDELGIINIISNNRTITGDNRELDIYLPDYKVAIEYNGVYWHKESSDKDTSSRHQDKTDRCKENDVELLHIFCDEWRFKTNLVKSFLKRKLNLIENNINASECLLKEVSLEDAELFFNQNNLDGFIEANMFYGLYNDDVLVSLMSYNIDKEYEMAQIISYTEKDCYGIVDGLSKCLEELKLYCKNNCLSYIVTSLDLRFGNTDNYKSLGFEASEEICALNCWYAYEGVRYTEYETDLFPMDEATKIYGCTNEILVLEL